MAAPVPIVFGATPNDVVPVLYGYEGMPNWYRVPHTWYARTDANSQIWASPNVDFSAPLYACKIHADGTMVFQNQLRSRQLGLA